MKKVKQIKIMPRSVKKRPKKYFSEERILKESSSLRYLTGEKQIDPKRYRGKAPQLFRDWLESHA